MGFRPPPRRPPPPVIYAAADTPSNSSPAEEGPPDEGDLDEVQRSALRHETRRAIFQLVARTPGLNKRQIASRIGIERSTAHHHLERLEAYDLVVLLPGARQDDEVLCFHPDHAHLWEAEETRLLYGQAPLRHVALYIYEDPGATTEEVAEALEAAPRTIQEHLARLRDLGLVEMHRFRRRVEHYPSDRLDAWANDVGDCYGRPWVSSGEG